MHFLYRELQKVIQCPRKNRIPSWKGVHLFPRVVTPLLYLLHWRWFEMDFSMKIENVIRKTPSQVLPVVTHLGGLDDIF